MNSVIVTGFGVMLGKTNERLVVRTLFPDEETVATHRRPSRRARGGA